MSANLLITGTDGGNTSNKISFLNDKGNIESFTIPTVIAPAQSSKINIRVSSKSDKAIPVENQLHVRINSTALPADKTNSFYYVGDYAKDKDRKIEPASNKQDKFNNELHIVTTLVGLAVAAIKANKDDKEVLIPYSGGLPIEEYKKIGDKALELILGKHEVEFIDGAYEGRRVILNIESGEIHVEGITSTLALIYDIKNNQLKESDEFKDLGDEYALADLGAGTTDLALFDEDGLNKYKSTNTEIGTNEYIDAMLEDIQQLEDFKDIVESLDGNDQRPFRTRDEFIRKVVKPEIDKLLHDETHQLKFTMSWAFVQDVDITEVVLKHMERYANEQKKDLMKFWTSTSAQKFVVVGGGLLFGYSFFKELKNRFMFPKNLIDSPYTTSKAYLIANYLEQQEKELAEATS